ncbi:MAG: S8 family serine peptidase [Phycisphaerales bacterium]|nr:MAG: S8 family serine peptidase [Phycisphaerales bacterium]
MKMNAATLRLAPAVVVFTVAGAFAEVTPDPVVLERAGFAPDRIIVRFEPMPEEAAAQARQSLPNVKRLRTLLPTSRFRSADPTEDGPHQIYIAELASGTDVVELSQQISAMPGVRYAEPDCIVCLDETFPDDPEFGELWGLHNTGQTGGRPDADIDAPEAWDITTGSEAVIVAVIDTGVDYNHPDLAANMWVNAGESGDGKETDGVDNDGNGYVDDVYGYDFRFDDPDPSDGKGHGTHVAGTIAAVGNNATGVVGVNWTARIMALRFLCARG